MIFIAKLDYDIIFFFSVEFKFPFENSTLFDIRKIAHKNDLWQSEILKLFQKLLKVK